MFGMDLSLGVGLGTMSRHLRVSGKPQDEGVTHRLWSVNRLDWGEPDDWQLEGLRAPSIKRKNQVGNRGIHGWSTGIADVNDEG